MAQLLLIRHGQASFGSDDYDRLSTLGFAQAGTLGRWFSACALPVDRVVSGSMRRHRETVEGWARELLEPASDVVVASTVDERFDEFDHEDVLTVYQRAIGASDIDTTPAALQRTFLSAVTRWTSGEHDADYIESWRHFRERCLDGFASITDDTQPAKSIVLFTSGGVIATICQHLMNLTDEAMGRLNWSLANTSVTRVRFTRGRRSLDSLNCTAHVDWARDLALLTYR
ncbi:MULTISPECIES: histidine phosphatase family protein [Paraburkholderia]|uniref:histidine phosphatase family protein n=1 Tax=Paraburkholderia TaxID=1822464 RepID=UPI00225831B0|nr:MULTISPECIES: histidine phosphatase family protein [Paraburkholderia]MCX4165697.1 histidine phosphatase family protein [Paraburkholderia megapolitana]MDN7161188.1 histidine phosphatase family protein [Paraburkholderia sp. CHISQ3]MDQ6498235.1 histidine phosphatase family protein [Paraburkholderia megapolitana]